ncbi:MAG: hypothetical protein Q4F83_04930 [Eubacteriales bacterium]|nr:hypothetical protein [Eubacteriales bacterium]
MINVSNEFKQLLADDKRDFLTYADITLKDGTVLSLDNSHIWENGFKIDDGVTDSGQFTIGNCIINKCTLVLNNIYDDFTEYDFDGAEAVTYLGLALDEADETVGRNLIANSKEVQVVRNNSKYNWITEKNPFFENTDYGFQKIQEGGSFTLSFDYEITNITTEKTALIMLYMGNSIYGAVANIPLSIGDNAGHIERTFTPTEKQMQYGTNWSLSGFGAGENEGAVITFRNIKLETGTIATGYTIAPEDVRIEKIQKGVFTVDDPTYNGATITLECLDNMHKSDRDYADVKTKYPATVGTIVQDICSVCGIPLLTTTFDGSDIVINERPSDDALTCRQVLMYCAQRACKFARCDVYGRLELKWFEQGIFEQNDNLDGGFFDDSMPSYLSGGTADGGTFDPWNVGYAANAGTFRDQSRFHHLYSMSALTVSTDDAVITGVSVTEEFQETETLKKGTYLYGTDGYVLSVSGNPFISAGQAKEVATFLGQKLIGLKFRPLSGSFLDDPTIEAGDLMYVTDAKLYTYNCLVTNLTFTVGNYMQISCDAETPRKNSAKRYSGLTQAIVQMRRDMEVKISEYDRTVQEMTQLISQGFGMYFITEKQPDGSEKRYMCDKPTIEESSYVVTNTSNGLMASVDGGTTWAVDKNGNALFNVLSVIGFKFDWARGGTLTLGGVLNGNGKLIILNSSGDQVGYIDNSGVHFNQGTFSGTLIGGLVTGSTIKSQKSGAEDYTEISGSYVNFYTDKNKVDEGGTHCGRIGPSTYVKEYGDGGVTLGFTNPALEYYSPTVHYFKGDILAGDSRLSVHALTAADIDAGSGLFLQDIHTFGNLRVEGTAYCGGLASGGFKSRIVDTEHYNIRMQYCYEMPSPMFGDIGCGTTDENGKCVVSLDDVFMETVNAGIEYQVFLQKEGQGDIWVDSKESAYFIVKGTPNLKFSWEVKVIQRDFEFERLEEYAPDIWEEDEVDYEKEYMEEIEQLINEQEELLYGTDDQTAEQSYDPEY